MNEGRSVRVIFDPHTHTCENTVVEKYVIVIGFPASLHVLTVFVPRPWNKSSGSNGVNQVRDGSQTFCRALVDYDVRVPSLDPEPVTKRRSLVAQQLSRRNYTGNVLKRKIRYIPVSAILRHELVKFKFLFKKKYVNYVIYDYPVRGWKKTK